jgi:hypothetical protein
VDHDNYYYEFLEVKSKRNEGDDDDDDDDRPAEPFFFCTKFMSSLNNILNKQKNALNNITIM